MLAHGSNERLQKLTWDFEQRAKAAYEQLRQDIASTLEGLVAAPVALKAELDALVRSNWKILNFALLLLWSGFISLPQSRFYLPRLKAWQCNWQACVNR